MGRHNAVNSWGLAARDITVDGATGGSETLSMLEALQDTSDEASETSHSSEEQELDITCMILDSILSVVYSKRKYVKAHYTKRV